MLRAQASETAAEHLVITETGGEFSHVCLFASNRAAMIQAVPWLEAFLREHITEALANRPCWLMCVEPGGNWPEGGWMAATNPMTPAPLWWLSQQGARELLGL